jgi:hypothetical protein
VIPSAAEPSGYAPAVALYVCNTSFGDYAEGEIVTAEAPLVSDWIEAKFLSPVDEDGNRLIEAATPEPTPSPESQPGTFAPAG